MSDILTRLARTIESRKGASPDTSYTAKLLSEGRVKVVRKFGEESIELMLAMANCKKEEVIAESADVVFHWLVLLADAGVTLEEVMQELEKREGTSGLEEKASRTQH